MKRSYQDFIDEDSNILHRICNRVKTAVYCCQHVKPLSVDKFSQKWSKLGLDKQDKLWSKGQSQLKSIVDDISSVMHNGVDNENDFQTFEYLLDQAAEILNAYQSVKYDNDGKHWFGAIDYDLENNQCIPKLMRVSSHDYQQIIHQINERKEKFKIKLPVKRTNDCCSKKVKSCIKETCKLVCDCCNCRKHKMGEIPNNEHPSDEDPNNEQPNYQYPNNEHPNDKQPNDIKDKQIPINPQNKPKNKKDIDRNKEQLNKCLRRLRREHPSIWQYRKGLIKKLLRSKFKSKYEGKMKIVDICGDGNCLVNALVYHRRKEYPKHAVQREREKIVDFMQKHKDKYSATIPDLDKYRKDGEWLLGEHIGAWHRWSQINVVVFTYLEDCDDFGFHVFYDKGFENRDTLYLLHDGNHYDYIQKMASSYKAVDISKAGISGWINPDDSGPKHPDLVKCDIAVIERFTN